MGGRWDTELPSWGLALLLLTLTVVLLCLIWYLLTLPWPPTATA